MISYVGIQLWPWKVQNLHMFIITRSIVPCHDFVPERSPGSICRKRVTASTAIPSSNGTAVGFVYTSEDSIKRSRSNMGLFSVLSMSLAQFVDPTWNTSKFLLLPNQHQVTRFFVHFLGRWTWSLQHFNQKNWLDKSGRFNPLASGPIRIDDLFGCLAFREAQFLTKTSGHYVY